MVPIQANVPVLRRALSPDLVDAGATFEVKPQIDWVTAPDAVVEFKGSSLGQSGSVLSVHPAGVGDTAAGLAGRSIDR